MGVPPFTLYNYSLQVGTMEMAQNSGGIYVIWIGKYCVHTWYCRFKKGLCRVNFANLQKINFYVFNFANMECQLYT